MSDNIIISEAMKCLYGGREFHDTLLESKDEDKITDEAEKEYRKMRNRASGKIRSVKDKEDEDELEESTMTPSRKSEMERIANKLPEEEFKKRYGDRWKSVKIATATKLMKQKRGIKEDMNYYSEMLNILEQAGYLESEDDFLSLAEAVVTFLEGSNDEYRSRLKRGQDPEQAQRAGSELAAKELKSKLGKGGLGHNVYGVASYENKGRQKDAQVLRSIRDTRKEEPVATSRQRRIKELSAKYRTEELECVIDYILSEDYANDVDDALELIDYLSEDTIDIIIEGYKSSAEAKRGLSSAKRSAHKKDRQASKGLRVYDYQDEEDEDDIKEEYMYEGLTGERREKADRITDRIRGKARKSHRKVSDEEQDKLNKLERLTGLGHSNLGTTRDKMPHRGGRFGLDTGSGNKAKRRTGGNVVDGRDYN